MDQDIQNKLNELNTKVDAVLASVEKTRRYFQIILWVTVVMVVLPVVGLLFAIPAFMTSYMASFEGLL